MFAFFFDENAPDTREPFGPQFASQIIAPIEQMEQIPTTRLLTGGLLHNLLVYEVEHVTFGGHSDTADEPDLGTPERSQHSMPNYDRRLAIICDLAETLSLDLSSFSETEIIEHLAQKNIWLIVTPSISSHQARTIHQSARTFQPYLGYSVIDLGNPLHRRLFLDSLFRDKAIGPDGLAFRRDEFDIDGDNDVAAFAEEYGSNRPSIVYAAREFDERFPLIQFPLSDSPRGIITAIRLANNDSSHRTRVARELMSLEREKITVNFKFSAVKPEDGIEFIFPPEKFTKYLLNLNHKDGGSKAKFFLDILDIQPDDWRYLADQILQGVKTSDFYRLGVSTYGASHGALAQVTGRNGKVATIETGWRLTESGPASFVTAYPTELSDSLRPNASRVPLPKVIGSARWQAIHEYANNDGILAAERAIPIPMVLEKYGTVWEGECGFAWVHLPDARSSFARWIVKHKHGHSSRPGVRIYSKATTQSHTKNRAYAAAYAEVLRSNGIKCDIGSHLD